MKLLCSECGEVKVCNEMPSSQLPPVHKPLTREQLDQQVCSGCITSRTCSMRNSTGTKQLRSGRVITVKTVMDCSIVDRYRRQWDPCYFDEPAEEPYSACVDPALQKVLDAERDIEMKKVDDLCEQDPRPDLSATCGQATECPCPGCCKEQECAPDTRPDSAEIDHDDPINRR